MQNQNPPRPPRVLHGQRRDPPPPPHFGEQADAAKNNMAIAEVGAPAREALAISAAAGALMIGVAVGLSALSRLVEDRRLVLV